MTVELGIALVCVPLVLFVVIAVAIRETPVLTRESADFEQLPRPVLAPLLVVLMAAGLFAAGSHGRSELLYLVLVVLSVAGAGLIERKLLATVAEIVHGYMNPRDWMDGRAPPGPRWRFQTKARYRDDPEWVDRIVLEMVSRHSTYAEFEHAVRADDFPPWYGDVLDRKLWGRAFPTARVIVKNLLVKEVFNNDGRFRSGKSPDQIFAELRELADGEHHAVLDRWQYYLCLRDLNILYSVLNRGCRPLILIGIVLLSAMVFCASVTLISTEALSISLILRATAAGALVWLLVVCASASILIVHVGVGMSPGTGTFSIARPTRGTDFDPLWTEVIQVGILAFAASFLVYGIGSPFLLQPSALDAFTVDRDFLFYAAGSSLLCVMMFVVHTVGVHNLMRGSRDNALDRASEGLRSASTQHDEGTLDHFKEVRGMRVWPLRASTVFQLAGGILLPVGAQALLIYAGLN